MTKRISSGARKLFEAFKRDETQAFQLCEEEGRKAFAREALKRYLAIRTFYEFRKWEEWLEQQTGEVK